MDQARATRFSVGLTGGIGSGKTSVANLFGELGASLVDTDLIAHALTGPNGAAMAAIEAEFGPGFATFDGALDRARMRELVFSDSAAKARLEAILHPRIRDAALAAGALADGPYVIYVVPLLAEAGGWRQRVQRVLVVDCPEALQIDRVRSRNGLSEEQVLAIMANQATRAQRLAQADDVVTNDGEVAALRPQIARLHGIYLAFSRRMSRNPRERL